ncbi:hypothetical protein RUM43_014762 [Polyplax serrata]|uniref:ANK_REP_REGION domain-containing protein n=1 Tax=Polyplax serrata TaxID=468196 RepID=A0AAN8S5V6_POLSC
MSVSNRNEFPFGKRYPLVLLNACQKGDLPFIKLLLRNYLSCVGHRVDTLDLDVLSIRDFVSASVFHYAARGDQVSVLRFLWPLLKGKPFPKTLQLSTPAHEAAAFGNLTSLQWLLKRSRSLMQATDIDGCNILHLAAR